MKKTLYIVIVCWFGISGLLSAQTEDDSEVWEFELSEFYVNPSSYVYSPSGKYRFGTFKNDGMNYYIEVKENGKLIPYLLLYGSVNIISGVYWVDDETIYFLKEKEHNNGSKYRIGYSTKFYEVSTND